MSAMKQCLFILFITGVIPPVIPVPRKFYLIQQEKTWTDAQAYCQAEYTDLGIIENNDDMVQLQNEAQRQKFSSSAWVGMYNDISSWHWSMGNESLGTLQLWKPFQPDNNLGIETCAAVSLMGWNDAPCDYTFPFLCYDDTLTGTDRYIYNSNESSWPDAQAYCRTHHTDLASVRDETENATVVDLTSGWTWFGLFRDTWKWVDQTKISPSIISWARGTPDNALWDENCAYLNNSQAADAQCSDVMPFFCYSFISGKQQIMKVNVMSSQDVNDPAVTMAILEQIKQRLVDHKMAQNVTVKWRVEPDGVVFQKKNENNTTL